MPPCAPAAKLDGAPPEGNSRQAVSERWQSSRVAELNFGAEATRSQKIRRAIPSFTKDVAVLPFDEACAERFGVVAATLATRGQPIGVYDSLFAAQARSSGAN